MKTSFVIAVFAGMLAAVPTAAGQTFAHLNIYIEGNVVSPAGGERGSVRMATSGVTIGETTRTTIGRNENACGLAVGPSPQPKAVSVWTVEVTPVQVYASAVTFQLKWARMRADGGEASSPSGDVRITLRPGESLPVDSLPVPAQGRMPAGVCDLTAATLRVAVTLWPRPEDDARLVNTELWLVEKLADGAERSQALTLRARFNQQTPFYFEPIPASGLSLQIFGAFTLIPVGNAYSLMLDTRYEMTVANPSAASATLAAEARRLNELRALFSPSRRVESVVSLTPGEVVEIQLPQLTAHHSVPGSASSLFRPSTTGTFAGRSLSIRIRARQVQ